ncbi:MAG: hypothetical protein M3Y53_08680, partial [Thermoproteota archaeon]|nr:hypothetical protein [Thermoproteota archaeon]
VTVLVTRCWNMLRLITGSITAFVSRLEKAGYVSHPKFVLSCSNSGLYHNGTRSTKIGSEKMNTLK